MPRALTSYPIFLITLFSLIAISYLILQSFNRITHQLARSTSDYFDQISVRYIPYDGGVYAEPLGVDCSEIYEVAVFSNDSRKVFKYTSSGRLFGPLVLPEGSLETVLLCYRGSREPKVLVLDVLNSRRVFNGLSILINEVNPPSLKVDVNSTNCLDKLSSIHGSRFFYVLKPVALAKEYTLTKGFNYNVSGHSLVVVNDSVIPIVVFNNTLGESIDVEGRFRDLLERYGEVTEYRKYTLFRYVNTSFVLNPIYRFERIYSTSRSITYVVNLNLGSRYALNETIAEFVVKHSVSVSIVDIYGNTYLADVTVGYNILADGGGVRKITLGNVSDVNDKQIIANLSKLTILPQACYSLRLSLTFNIYIKRALLSPVYVTINHVIRGGLPNNVFLNTHFFDKLVFNIDGSQYGYYPLINGTTVDVTIKASVFDNSFNITLLNQTFLTSNYSSEFRGKFVHIADLIHPSATVTTPLYVSINATNVGVKIYTLNIVDGLTVVYGLYFSETNLNLLVTYKPVVLINQTDYIVVENSVNYVYLLNISTELKLYIPSNGAYSYLKLPASVKFVGFLVYERVVYETPLLVVENIPRGLTLRLSIVYINGSTDILTSTTGGIVRLKEEPVVSVNLTLFNPTIDGELSLFTSWRVGYVVIIRSPSSISAVSGSTFGNLGPYRYVVFILNDGKLVPTNTFSSPSSI